MRDQIGRPKRPPHEPSRFMVASRQNHVADFVRKDPPQGAADVEGRRERMAHQVGEL